MYEAIRHFSYFLHGRCFRAITDHKGLLSLRSGRQENKRIMNWSLKLSEFDYEMVYRAGDQNVVADELSRCYANEDWNLCQEGTRLKEEGGDVGVQKALPHEL